MRVSGGSEAVVIGMQASMGFYTAVGECWALDSGFLVRSRADSHPWARSQLR